MQKVSIRHRCRRCRRRQHRLPADPVCWPFPTCPVHIPGLPCYVPSALDTGSVDLAPRLPAVEQWKKGGSLQVGVRRPGRQWSAYPPQRGRGRGGGGALRRFAGLPAPPSCGGHRRLSRWHRPFVPAAYTRTVVELAAAGIVARSLKCLSQFRYTCGEIRVHVLLFTSSINSHPSVHAHPLFFYSEQYTSGPVYSAMTPHTEKEKKQKKDKT